MTATAERHSERMAKAWSACDDFNAKNPVGTRVRYTAVQGRESTHDIVDTVTRSEAWTLPNGEAMVMVKGKSGGVSLRHVEVLE